MLDDKQKFKVSDPFLQLKQLLEEQRATLHTFNTFVIGALLIGFLTLLFALGALIIDAWRFNSTAYKETTAIQLQKEIADQQKSLLFSVQALQKDVDQLKKR